MPIYADMMFTRLRFTCLRPALFDATRAMRYAQIECAATSTINIDEPCLLKSQRHAMRFAAMPFTLFAEHYAPLSDAAAFYSRAMRASDVDSTP